MSPATTVHRQSFGKGAHTRCFPFSRFALEGASHSRYRRVAVQSCPPKDFPAAAPAPTPAAHCPLPTLHAHSPHPLTITPAPYHPRALLVLMMTEYLPPQYSELTAEPSSRAYHWETLSNSPGPGCRTWPPSWPPPFSTWRGIVDMAGIAGVAVWSMSCDELCWTTVDYCVVSCLLSCTVLHDVLIRPCPQHRLAWLQLAHNRPLGSLSLITVCPPPSPRTAWRLSRHSLNARSSLARSRAPLLAVGAALVSSVITRRSPFGNNKLDCPGTSVQAPDSMVPRL